MVIRTATIADARSLAEIQVDSYRTAYAGILPQEYLEQFSIADQEHDWRDLTSTLPAGRLLLAVTEQSKPAGYAFWEPCSESFPGFDAELIAIHVSKAHQRLGIGRELIAAIVESSQNEGARSLFLWVLNDNPACAFYERLRAKVIGRKAWPGNESYGTSVEEIAYGWADLESLSTLLDR